MVKKKRTLVIKSPCSLFHMVQYSLYVFYLQSYEALNPTNKTD